MDFGHGDDFVRFDQPGGKAAHALGEDPANRLSPGLFQRDGPDLNPRLPAEEIKVLLKVSTVRLGFCIFFKTSQRGENDLCNLLTGQCD